MNGNEHSRKSSSGAADPLAELIRTAGRRPTPPQEHFDSVFAAAHSAWRAKLASRRKTRLIVSMAASIAAVACSALLLAILLPRTSATVAVSEIVVGNVSVFSSEDGQWRPLDDEASAVRAGDVIRTAAESGAAFSLDGGASLRIAASTELRLDGPAAMTLQIGAAYVDSGRDDTSAGVTISTTFGSVRDIGTQFEVRALPSSLRVRVRTGRVELTQADDEKVLTRAGEEARVSETGAVERHPFAPSHPDWEWTRRLAVAPPNDRLSILVYLEWAANEYGRELQFDSPNTELQAGLSELNTPLSGFTPEEVLDSIALTSGFSYRLLSDDAILISGQ